MKGSATKENGLSSLMHGLLRNLPSDQGDVQVLAGDSKEDRGKITELQQTEIGEFPTTWKVERVDSAFEIQQGKQVSKKNREGDNQLPFLRTKNVFWNRLDLSDLDQMNFTETEETRLELQPDDLLVCEGGSIGRTALWNAEVDGCLYQNHLHRLRMKGKKAEPQYGVYWLWYAFDIAKLYFGRGNVTTIPNLSRSKLAELPMALPPLPEQKKIAHVLSTVQRAIEAQERIIQTTTELKKTLMRKLFTEGITKDFREDWDISTLKQEIWPMGRLGEYAEFKNGINFTKAQKGEIGVPTVDVKNMYGNGFAVGVDNLYRVDIDIKDDYFLRKGDLLFVRSSLKQEGIGWTNQYLNNSEPTTFCGFIIRARLKDQEITDPSFLTFYFRSDDARRSLITSSGKVAITNISQGILSKSLIPLPPLSEQKKVTQILSTVQQAIEVQESKKATLQDLFRTLLHEMMTAKTRVNDV